MHWAANLLLSPNKRRDRFIIIIPMKPFTDREGVLSNDFVVAWTKVMNADRLEMR